VEWLRECRQSVNTFVDAHDCQSNGYWNIIERVRPATELTLAKDATDDDTNKTSIHYIFRYKIDIFQYFTADY